MGWWEWGFYTASLGFMKDDPLGEHVKTVYAHFGLAVYSSQVLEHGLANAMLIFQLVPRAAAVAKPSSWPSRVDSFIEEQFQETLGRLIRKLQKVASVPSHLEQLLARALERRNWLSHHYFRERATEFLSAAGRDTMIAELEEAQALFQEADAALEAVSKPVRERYGYTEALLTRIEEQMRRDAHNDL